MTRRMGMVPNIPRVGSMFWGPDLASDMSKPTPLTTLTPNPYLDTQGESLR